MVRVLLHQRANKSPLRPATREIQIRQLQAQKAEYREMSKMETGFPRPQAPVTPQSLAPVQDLPNPRQKITTQIAKNTDHL
ncbi:hypothetical protein GQ44DRAFT_717712 [Phaeosphaeriaceae sp. PMI808]|nr:hypothetical protein GQ44DRAFT_717712 [Phaeosphaeriaceae sp. PMI808]